MRKLSYDELTIMVRLCPEKVLWRWCSDSPLWDLAPYHLELLGDEYRRSLEYSVAEFYCLEEGEVV